MTELKYTSRPRRWDITRNHREKVFSSPRWGCPPLNFSHSLKIPLISINFICDWKHWPYPVPPPPYLLQLFSGPVPFLHASLGCSFTSACHPSVHLPWQLSSVASILKKTHTHWKSSLFFSHLCGDVVPCHYFSNTFPFAASCQMFFSVSLFNSSVLSNEMTTPPIPPPLLSSHSSAWLVCVPSPFPSPVGLDEFMLFPFNQNKPWSHDNTLVQIWTWFEQSNCRGLLKNPHIYHLRLNLLKLY